MEQCSAGDRGQVRFGEYSRQVMRLLPIGSCFNLWILNVNLLWQREIKVASPLTFRSGRLLDFPGRLGATAGFLWEVRRGRVRRDLGLVLLALQDSAQGPEPKK